MPKQRVRLFSNAVGLACILGAGVAQVNGSATWSAILGIPAVILLAVSLFIAPRRSKPSVDRQAE